MNTPLTSLKPLLAGKVWWLELDLAQVPLLAARRCEIVSSRGG